MVDRIVVVIPLLVVVSTAAGVVVGVTLVDAFGLTA